MVHMNSNHMGGWWSTAYSFKEHKLYMLQGTFIIYAAKLNIRIIFRYLYYDG